MLLAVPLGASTGGGEMLLVVDFHIPSAVRDTPIRPSRTRTFYCRAAALRSNSTLILLEKLLD